MAADAALDLEVQRGYDSRRGMSFRLLACRFTACIDARKAVALAEPHATFALRQALIDLSSCAREMASTLPEPQVHLNRRKQPRRR